MSKTVLLVRNAAANDFGGAETYQVSIAQILSKLNYAPIVVTASVKLQLYTENNNVNSIKGLWWSHQRWSGSWLMLFPVYVIWQVILTGWYIGLFKRTGADIIHLQSKDDFIAGTLAGYLLKRKVVWTDHMDLRYVFENISKPLKNPVGKLVFWAARFADHIILISNNEHTLVTGHFKDSRAFKDKITIVNNGVIDTAVNFNHEDKGPDSVFSFCVASRIVVNKGIGEAISAFEQLQDRLDENRDNFQFDIYGDGSDIDKFKKMAHKNKSIVFHGHQTDSIAKIATSDVFILPSYQEGFSIALLEATMLGKAIIASSVDSNPEIIQNEKTGLLVEVRNPKSLSDAMYSLATDSSLRKTLEINARKNYEEHFNLERIVREQIIALYEA